MSTFARAARPALEWLACKSGEEYLATAWLSCLVSNCSDSLPPVGSDWAPVHRLPEPWVTYYSLVLLCWWPPHQSAQSSWRSACPNYFWLKSPLEYFQDLSWTAQIQGSLRAYYAWKTNSGCKRSSIVKTLGLQWLQRSPGCSLLYLARYLFRFQADRWGKKWQLQLLWAHRWH